MNYSVLMSVYYKEKPEFLASAIESVYKQTVLTDDFVIVCDGQLTAELNEVILNFKKTYGKNFNVIQLPENVGLGRALNEGIKHCKNELIARMDSDDIAMPNRCEQQLNVFNSKPEIDICSAAVQEFIDYPGDSNIMRVPPEYNNQIIKFSKKRNPFNHPCVMYKKSAVEAAGGYQDFYLLEDYYLWLRMLINGCVGYNLQNPLLWMRAGSDMYKRRAGLKYAKTQQQLFKFMREQNYISFADYISSCIIRTLSSLAPNCLREHTFKKMLRKH